MKTILICCPYAVNLRNLFLTDTFPTLMKDQNVRLVCLTTLPEDSKFLKAYASERVIFEKIELYQPSHLESIFNHMHRLMFLPFSAYLRFLYAPKLVRYPYLKSMLNSFWSTGLHRRDAVIHSIQNLRRFLFFKRHYDSLISQYKPRLVVATRLFGTDEYHILLSAKQMRIPTVMLVASWDNLYCYSYLPVRPDRMIVWNEVMLRDAVEKHAFPDERVTIIGPPQFDIYFEKDSLPSKAEYFTKLRLDLSKKLITFTTSDILDNQPAMALMVYMAVVQQYSDRQLLVRVHPQEDFDGYLHLPAQYQRLILDIPGKKAAGSVDRIFSRQDFHDLACCMKYSDVVINVCSTITLDAAVADTPVICYRCLDAYTDKDKMKKVIEAHDRDHFSALMGVNGLRVVESNEHLAELVDKYSADRSVDADKRAAVTSLMVPYTDGSISRRLGENLLKMINDGMSFQPQ